MYYFQTTPIENTEAQLIGERKSNFAKLDAQILFREKICLPVNIRKYSDRLCTFYNIFLISMAVV